MHDVYLCRKKGAVIRASIDNDNDMYASIDKASHKISSSLKKHNEMHHGDLKKQRRFQKVLIMNDEEEELEEVVFDEESMPALGGTLLCVKRLTILVNTL